jgi:hypothetical protein
MQLTPLLFIRETEKARLYTSAEWKDLWIPKSVVTSTIKIPSSDPLQHDTHIVTVQDWWYDKMTGVGNEAEEEYYFKPDDFPNPNWREDDRDPN